MKKVFLGGTCNESTWRDKLIKMLEIDYFNPVVDDWTEECYQEELRQRKICDYCLYVITPRMKGVYSIAEVGLKCPIFVSKNVWLFVVFIYIFIASVAPVWILQPLHVANNFYEYTPRIAK